MSRGPQTPICCWDCSVADLDFQSKSGALPAFLASILYRRVSHPTLYAVFSLQFPRIRALLWRYPPAPVQDTFSRGAQPHHPASPAQCPGRSPLPAGRPPHSLLRPASLPPPPGLLAPPAVRTKWTQQLRCRRERLRPALGHGARGPLPRGRSLLSRMHTVWLSRSRPDRPGRPLKEDDI